MSSFVDIPITVDASQIEQDVYDQLADAFPGWDPADGNLETWLVKALSQMAADLGVVAADVPAAIFAEFGDRIMQLPPTEALPAVGLTTWTMVDDAGYTIPRGTLVGIAAAGDDVVAFETAEDAIVAPGSTTIADVAISAVVEGEAANALDGATSVIDALAFVDSVALQDPTSGGADAELPDDYLDRLAAEMTLLTPRPILPGDAEVLARRIPEIARALALDGYNPVDETTGNERMVAVAVQDESGEPVSSAGKAAVDELLQAKREINFIFNVIDPTYTTINVDFELTCFPGFDPDVVHDAVIAALSDYLEPAAWGRSPLTPETEQWREVSTLRRSELVTLVNLVQGVDFVTTLHLAISPTTPSADADLTLDTPAPLTRPGTITGTANAP